MLSMNVANIFTITCSCKRWVLVLRWYLNCKREYSQCHWLSGQIHLSTGTIDNLYLMEKQIEIRTPSENEHCNSSCSIVELKSFSITVSHLAETISRAILPIPHCSESDSNYIHPLAIWVITDSLIFFKNGCYLCFFKKNISMYISIFKFKV